MNINLNPPALVIRTEKLGLEWWMDGRYFGPVVLLRHDAYGWTLTHELEHVRQWWTAGLWLHDLRYHFSREYRQWCEVRAYRAEIAAVPEASRNHHRVDCAKWLVEHYDFDLTFNEAIQLLKEP